MIKHTDGFTLHHVVRGFTLIELLVVIAIIGILSAVGLASFSTSQARARDAVRKSDFAQLKRAIEMAKNDSPNASFYPDGYANCGQMWPQYTGAYIKRVPCDPKTGEPYPYTGTTSGSGGTGLYSLSLTGYFMQIALENSSDPDLVKSQNKCCPALLNSNFYCGCPD